jgi:hypothetical protein
MTYGLRNRTLLGLYCDFDEQTALTVTVCLVLVRSEESVRPRLDLSQASIDLSVSLLVGGGVARRRGGCGRSLSVRTSCVVLAAAISSMTRGTWYQY